MVLTHKQFGNYYIIVSKKNGRMLLQGSMLPIYWQKKIAEERCKLFPEFVVKFIHGRSLNRLIEESTKPFKKEK